MDLSTKGSLNDTDFKLNSPNKPTKLNPHAAEFVPFALRSPTGPTNNTCLTLVDATGKTGKAVLDRSESSVSNTSDDEARQYWHRKLPDDITPDFKFMGGEELQGPRNISLAGLSIQDVAETSGISGYMGETMLLNKHQDISSHGIDGVKFGDKMRYSGPTSTEGPSVPTFRNLPTSPWEKQFIHGDQSPTNGCGEGHLYDSNSNAGFLNDLLSENAILEDNETNAVEFLASQFPGFAAESLAEVYYANGCDLNLTIEMLTELELQGDNGFNQNMSSKALSAPNLTALDFPALPVVDSENGLPKYAGEELLHPSNSSYQSSGKENFLLFQSSSNSGPTYKATDFASAVRKLASQDSGQWKYGRNGSDVSTRSNRQSPLLSSSYAVHGRSANGDSLQNYGGSRAAPVWVETGEAVANLYSELRDEARDHARLRNACFEQARQAYLIGNKALAKELSVKGQLHNMQMKAAHGKARDSIYQQRNPAKLQGYSRGQDPIIDLHGLHVNEAIHILKQELSVLRSTARLAGQRLQVLICVGTGHHTKGSRTPARLPIAVERYLLEEERLEYTEPQPGLLRVVI